MNTLSTPAMYITVKQSYLSRNSQGRMYNSMQIFPVFYAIAKKLPNTASSDFRFHSESEKFVGMFRKFFHSQQESSSFNVRAQLARSIL